MKLTEQERINREMEEILRRQADPNRPSPLVEFWDYLDKRNSDCRRALAEQEGRDDE